VWINSSRMLHAISSNITEIPSLLVSHQASTISFQYQVRQLVGEEHQVAHRSALPPGVYLWDIPIPTVSLYLAISNHVAAAAVAVLSLTLSAGISPAPVCAVVSSISNHLAAPDLLAPQLSQTSVTTTTPPPHPPPRPSPSPAVSSLPRQTRRRPCFIKPPPSPSRLDAVRVNP